MKKILLSFFCLMMCSLSFPHHYHRIHHNSTKKVTKDTLVSDTVKDTVEVIKKETIKMIAKYYGNKYKTARRTANGERFNMYAMTCAAPKRYPFGTKLKVTNIRNNKSVIVKVTDRGRFGERMVDLTYGAFEKISKPSIGKIDVKIEIVK